MAFLGHIPYHYGLDIYWYSAALSQQRITILFSIRAFNFHRMFIEFTLKVKNQSYKLFYLSLSQGITLVPAYGVGWILGGVIVRRTKMGFKMMFVFAFACVLISLGGFIFSIFFGCSNPHIAGVNYGNMGQRWNVNISEVDGPVMTINQHRLSSGHGIGVQVEEHHSDLLAHL